MNIIVKGITAKNELEVFSKGEERVRKLLSKRKIKFYREVEIKGMINPKTGYSLRLDFFLPKYNIAIEYNGKQHYDASYHKDEESFEQQQYRDEIKSKFCKDNKIKLITISYKQQSDIANVLHIEIPFKIKYVIRHNIKLPKKALTKEIKKELTKKEMLNNILKHKVYMDTLIPEVITSASKLKKKRKELRKKRKK